MTLHTEQFTIISYFIETTAGGAIPWYICDIMLNRDVKHAMSLKMLTHWGRVTHICVIDLTSIGSDNGLSPGRRQAIIRANAGILLIRPLGTIFSEFLVEILIFSLKKMRLKVSSAKRRPFCLGLNVLINWDWTRWVEWNPSLLDYRGRLPPPALLPGSIECSQR